VALDSKAVQHAVDINGVEAVQLMNRTMMVMMLMITVLLLRLLKQ